MRKCGVRRPLYAEMRDLPLAEGVVARDVEIETADGYPMRARWYRKEGSDARSAVMYVHGGGMILMGIDEMDADISRYVALSGVPFLSIGYRLAPEHPRPQAEDALDGYLWLIGHADELGIDAHRVAIMGDSGGAGIAAGAAILARDRGVPLAKQILIYPMLDDRTVACDDELDGLAHVWFAENNKMAWEAVLGERRGTDEVLPCEAPVRNEASRAWRRLSWRWASSTCSATKPSSTRSAWMAAHVPAELHVLTGLTHTFDTFPLPIADKAFEYRSYVISQL
ncbi:MAG: alpha/beta hydrolase [Adlercreutzia equolifaciens]